MHEAVDEMSRAETFRGYPPETGWDFLLEAIARHDYEQRGVKIATDEIVVSDGSKTDTANIQEIFAADCVVALTDPVYPVYLDSNVMAGRVGTADAAGRFDRVVYLPCTADHGFLPRLPDGPVDLIYLCYPNNPTGAVMTRAALKRWVDYARERSAVILYDAAYEAYIRDPAIPHSIYEIEGAREVAIEFRSFSKSAGFTGTRCAYTVVPKELQGRSASGEPVSLHALWVRRQSTKFNGVAYVIPRRGAARLLVLCLVGALVLRAQPFERLRVEAQPEREAHLAQDRLDLVQRFLAEVLGLQQLRLRLLHEVGDRPDVRRLEAVGRADGQLQLVDVAEEVLVQLGARARLVAFGGFLLGRGLGEVREEVEVVLEDPRRLADRGEGADAAVGPHLEHQSLASLGAHGLDVEVHTLDGREVGVEQDRVDRQRFRLPLLGRHVPAAALDAHFHLEDAVLVEGRQHDVRREDLDIGVRLEVARLDDRRALGLQPEDLGPVHVEREHHRAQVHHDVERVVHDARQMRELVEDVLDLHPGRRGAVDRRQEGSPVGDADGQREAGLEGLDGQLAVLRVLDGPVVTCGKLKLQH